MWIDAHCHLSDPRIAANLGSLIERSKENGIHGWVQGGTWPDEWKKQLELKARYGRGIITSFGLHPWWVVRSNRAELDPYLELLEKELPQADALGELGLDTGPRANGTHQLDLQKQIFEEQLKIAKKLSKPLILHVVRAHTAAFEILEKVGPFPEGGMIHAFSGSFEAAQLYLSLGFMISVGGSITRNGYETLKRGLAKIPDDRLLIETDAPDQLPHLPSINPESLNEPANLLLIAEALEDYRDKDAKALLHQSTENLRRIFKDATKPI